MVNVLQPFDFYEIFVNEIVGGLGLFAFLCSIGIIYFGGKAQLPFPAILTLIILFNASVYAATFSVALGVVAALVSSIVFYVAYSRLVDR